MANFTEDENATNQTVGFASTLPAGIYVFLFAINIFLSLTAFLGNSLILIALRKESSLHSPSKLLFGCLAVTDLGVGLISQPLYAIIVLGLYVTDMNSNILLFVLRVCSASSINFCGVSILTSAAISVDRLLALLLGLRYRHFVTLRRVRVVIPCFWLIAFSFVLIHLFLSHFIALYTVVGLSILSFVISVVSYTKIFLTLRQLQAQLQAQVQGQPNRGEMPLNVARYKTTVSSIAWVQLALAACYVPFFICYIIANVIDYGYTTTTIAMEFSTTLLYLNSSLNPLLYCWKIREVKHAVKTTIRQLFCCVLC